MSEVMADEALTAFLAQVGKMPIEKRVKLYVKTREARKQLTDVFEQQDGQYKSILEYVENSLLEEAVRTGVEGFKTPYGTTYMAETARYSVADETAFTTFLDNLPPEDARYSFFERRISSTHVAAYLEIHDGALPPGLNQFRQKVMRIRKSNGKKENGP